VVSKPKYVIWIKGNLIGEFEFCTSTQANYCRSLEDAKEEIEGRDFDWEDGEGDEGYDVPTEHYVIYKMTLEKMN